MILKKIFTSLAVLVFFLIPQFSFAASQSEATNLYKQALINGGVPESTAQKKADQESKSLLEFMENAQLDAEIAFDALDVRIKSLNKNDGRRDEAIKAMGVAQEKVSIFKKLPAQSQFDVQEVIAGALPRLLPTAEFSVAQTQSTEAMSEVNRILILPQRPGTVPEGDLVLDFIPQLIRQLFRFAWLAILIVFTVSGIFMVLVRDNEDRLTNAKTMIYYSFIGFAIISLAFALVKAITDIDFFGFI